VVCHSPDGIHGTRLGRSPADSGTARQSSSAASSPLIPCCLFRNKHIQLLRFGHKSPSGNPCETWCHEHSTQKFRALSAGLLNTAGRQRTAFSSYSPVSESRKTAAEPVKRRVLPSLGEFGEWPRSGLLFSAHAVQQCITGAIFAAAEVL
jgi:hypothetical protein